MNYIEWLVIGIMFGILLFKDFLFSYFKKKGENLATKEDIENITKKIEETKSDINLVYKNVEFINDKENNILLSIFDDLTILFNELFVVNFGDIYGPKENYIDEMKQYEKQFYKIITSILIKYHHALVYVKNEEILNHLTKLIEQLLKIKKSFKKNFSGVKIAGYEEISELSNKNATSNSIKEKIKNTNKYVKQYYDEINPLKDKLNKLYREYIFLLKSFFNKSKK